ncbi:MAG: hypothetical protein ABSD74_10580 [Rhizomicrobium sp.]|jgi:antitoxin component YwqK of YwqJK toxin-antitoxin module
MSTSRFQSAFARRAAVIVAIAAGIVAGISSGAAADTHYYRNALTFRTAPPYKYVDEIPAPLAMQGTSLLVTTDGQGHIQTVEKFVDGKSTGKTIYQYPANSALPDSDQTYLQGVLTSVTRYQRAVTGEATRADNFDAKGARTGYWTETFSSDHSDGSSYNADGTLSSTWTNYYAANGLEVRSTSVNAGSTRSLETEYDPATGQVRTTRTFENGKLIYYFSYTRDSNQSVIRKDAYQPDGTWFAAEVFANGLRQKRLYKYADGSTKEIRFEYDSNRWASKATQFVNDKFICTFVFERLGDGTIKRTLALGPDGSLWAEYPDEMADDVDKTGHLNGKPSVGTIHKTGNWW